MNISTTAMQATTTVPFKFKMSQNTEEAEKVSKRKNINIQLLVYVKVKASMTVYFFLPFSLRYLISKESQFLFFMLFYEISKYCNVAMMQETSAFKIMTESSAGKMAKSIQFYIHGKD